MRIPLAVAVCVGLLVGIAIGVPSGEAKVKEWDIRTATAAEVTDVDDMAGRLTIKWLNAVQGVTYDTYTEITLKVPQDARIVKGGQREELSDVVVGETIGVQYYLDDDGRPTLMSASVTE